MKNINVIFLLQKCRLKAENVIHVSKPLQYRLTVLVLCSIITEQNLRRHSTCNLLVCHLSFKDFFLVNLTFRKHVICAKSHVFKKLFTLRNCRYIFLDIIIKISIVRSLSILYSVFFRHCMFVCAHTYC